MIPFLSIRKGNKLLKEHTHMHTHECSRGKQDSLSAGSYGKHDNAENSVLIFMATLIVGFVELFVVVAFAESLWHEIKV